MMPSHPENAAPPCDGSVAGRGGRMAHDAGDRASSENSVPPMLQHRGERMAHDAGDRASSSSASACMACAACRTAPSSAAAAAATAAG